MILFFSLSAFDSASSKNSFSFTFQKNDNKLEIFGAVKGDHRPLEGATIEVFENNNIIQQVVSDEYGEFIISLNLNSNFIIEIQKQDYVSKRFQINTTTPDNTEKDNKYFFDFVVSLFISFDDPDLKLLEKPLGIIQYEKNTHNFSFDRAYSKNILSHLDSITTRHSQLIKNYNNAVSSGNENFQKQKYELAKNNFENAQSLQPKESYPKERLTEIYNILKTLHETDLKYKRIIETADKLDSAKIYKQAIDNYKLALTVKPNETYPKDKINQINKTLNDIKNADITYSKLILKGDSLLKNKNYSKSLDAYKKALFIKNEETYPKQKIEFISNIFFEQQLYKKYVNTADSLVRAKNPELALNYFENALKLKPDDQTVKELIAKTKQVIATKTKENAENKRYKMTLDSADRFFIDQKYNDARIKYIIAQNIRPNEKYPSIKIKKIDELLKQLAVQEKQQTAYNDTIKSAEKYFNSGELNKAIESYQRAKQLIPVATYPDEQIALIKSKINQLQIVDANYKSNINTADQLFNKKDFDHAYTFYAEAKKNKSTEIYPEIRMNEVMTILKKQKEDSLNQIINNAEISYKSRDIDNALKLYQKAENINPDDETIKNKITELTEQINQNRNDVLKYNTLIERGDNAFRNLDYKLALSSYSEALKIKPDQQYPQNKINDIEKKYSENTNKDISYSTYISRADSLFKSGDLNGAKNAYKRASFSKPQEDYPLNKIREIDETLNKNSTAENRRLINLADGYYNKNRLKEAREYYKKAIILIPAQKYPKDQIDKINKQLIYDDYNNLIKTAEEYFNKNEYEKSKPFYMQALLLKPDETLPKTRLSELSKLIKQYAFANAIDEITSEIIKNNSSKKFTFEPLKNKSVSNYITIKARNISGKSFKIILNYGKDNTNSGGSVLKIGNSKEVNEYKILIGAQSDWVQEDNNWLSLSPVGGNIEILGIQIKDGQ